MIFIEQIIKQLSLEHDEVNKYSPLTLAYLGDCVYEIIIRTMLVYEGNSTVNKLHERASLACKGKITVRYYKVIRSRFDGRGNGSI